MRRYPGSSPRQAWYDRNPLMVAASYAAIVGPVGGTQRWAYVVPAGRKAYVEVGFVSQVRQTVAAPVANSDTYLYYQPSGGAAYILVDALQQNNTVGARVSESVGQSVTMLAGDQLSGYTADSSTGGTVYYVTAFKATEFDA